MTTRVTVEPNVPTEVVCTDHYDCGHKRITTVTTTVLLAPSGSEDFYVSAGAHLTIRELPGAAG